MKLDQHFCSNKPRNIQIEYDITSTYANERMQWFLLRNGFELCKIKYCPFCSEKLPVNEVFHEKVLEAYV